MTMNIGELKAVAKQGVVIGFYCLREDDCYEVAWVNEYKVIQTTSLDTLSEVKNLLKEEYNNRCLYEK